MENMQKPFTDILVPLDGSVTAERALTPALELATRTGAPLRVLQRVATDDKEVAAAYLAGVADRLAGTIDVDTLVVVDLDSVPDAIVEGLEPGTLVCMSSHGRGGISRAVMGSVTEALLRVLDRPALVVGPHLSDRFTFAGRIVACIDGSRESERTLGPARQWSAAFGLPLWLMEVGEPGPPAEWITHGDAVEAAHVARLAHRLGHVQGWEVLHGKHPDRALADMAASASDPAALLVMATHGRTGWDRLRLGSVTAATAQVATVPVLVVPAAPVETAGPRPEAAASGTTEP